jgi:cysteine desulfuration protein SufE
MPDNQKLQLLLEYSEALVELPNRFGTNPELLERVVECQSPVFIAVEGNRAKVRLFFSAPKEAPTTRGFASVLHAAFDGLSADEILEADTNFVDSLGLAKLVSPLRIRGMSGMLRRILRKTGELS